MPIKGGQNHIHHFGAEEFKNPWLILLSCCSNKGNPNFQMMQPQNGRVSIILGASDTHWTCNMSKTQTRRMLSFRFEISCYHSVTSLCWLTCQPNQRASWDFSELIGKTASLFLWYYKHTLRYLSLELPTAILPLGTKMKLLRSKQIQEVKKKNRIDLIRILEYSWAQSCLTLWLSQWCEKDVPIIA